MTADWTTVRTGDGRDLEVLRHGPEDAYPLVFHFGTPNAPDEFPRLFEALDARGWQLVSYARPGYGGSTRHEGRSVADAAGDTAAILDAARARTLRHASAGRAAARTRWPARRCSPTAAAPRRPSPASRRSTPRGSTSSPAWARRTSRSSAPPRAARADARGHASSRGGRAWPR